MSAEQWQWEYLVTPLIGDAAEQGKRLRELGREKWDLVQIDFRGQPVAYMKRVLHSTPWTVTL